MSVAIKIENVSKLYRLGTVGTGTISHDLNRWWHRIRGKDDPYAKVGQENDRTKARTDSAIPSPLASSPSPLRGAGPDYVWALHNINLEIQQGEILGIIGRNGAGKSTLLKLLSRVTAPTTGSIKTRGRIASLLEVGTGFHPELTGRENIYLNGAILGMKRHEITRQLDEIVEFSGCAKYLDTPVKRYSSGMMVRLGFAVAAHLDCQILIVDEVLAVGDAEFQRKCISKMQDMSSQKGRTVLLVSHSMATVSALSTRSALLSNGRIESVGETSNVIKQHLQSQLSNGSYQSELSGRVAAITAVKIKPSENPTTHYFGKAFEVEIEVTCSNPVKGASIGLQILDSVMRPIAYAWVFDSEIALCRNPGTYRLNCFFENLRIYQGSYSLAVHFAEPKGGRKLDHVECICPFNVEMVGTWNDRGWSAGIATYIDDFIWRVDEC